MGESFKTPSAINNPRLRLHKAVVGMEQKRDDAEISSCSLSTKQRETASEKIPEEGMTAIQDEVSSHIVHDPGLATWRLFVIIGGYGFPHVSLIIQQGMNS